MRRHRRKLSGPLLDRMDLLVTVQRPTEAELTVPGTVSSAGARECVTEARERQRARLAGTLASCNGEMDVRLVRRCVRLDSEAEEALGLAYASGTLSARGLHRVLRVATTIADLGREGRVRREHVLTALALRQRTGRETALAA